MEPKKLSVSKRQIFEKLIALFCSFVSVCSIGVLLFVYEPTHNSLAALGTVCMDVLSMIVLIILILNLTFDRGGLSITTQLFLGIMLATLWAIFLDFLTWAFDGSLSYYDITYSFIFLSLIMGAVLAAIFVVYLAYYLDDMYNIPKAHKHAKVCFIFNSAAFIITVIMAITGNAFVITDGHYQLGPYYDVITVIPILTVFYMTGYSIKNIKTIGLHDVIAVTGYSLTMIVGALVEAEFGVGATYVSIAMADVFIFLMLQNKLIDRVKRQREILAEKISSQYEILESMAGIYSHVNYIDLENYTVQKFNFRNEVNEIIDLSNAPHSDLNKNLYDDIRSDQKNDFWDFTNLLTLSQRMAYEKIISAEFYHAKEGWIRAHYIRLGDSVNEPVKKVIYAIRNIDEEKKNVETLIKKSNTDELTGFYNRHAYEDEIRNLEKETLDDNFVYITIDINSLKITNDMLGHEAGDELIIGACKCMKQCFGSYGRLYRTGGDEFVAIIYANDYQLNKIKHDMVELTEKWKGSFNQTLTISCGYVTKKEAEDLNLHQIAVLADKRMYEDKTNYYQRKGVDRRGQSAAHIALHALYTKILKINITDDTYEIVNLSEAELLPEKGFSENLSDWFINLGKSGMIHPDDVDLYFEQIDLEFLRNHFRSGATSYKVSYRRKVDDIYATVLLEIIPANDYSHDSQKLFLYVKTI